MMFSVSGSVFAFYRWTVPTRRKAIPGGEGEAGGFVVGGIFHDRDSFYSPGNIRFVVLSVRLWLVDLWWVVELLVGPNQGVIIHLQPFVFYGNFAS